MNYMNLIVVVTTPSIYHGWSTWKTFWEVNFTTVDMKNCGLCNVRKHRDINNGEQYISLDISLKFGNLENIKTTYSEPKDCLGRSGIRGWLPLWVSRPLEGQNMLKRKCFPLLKSALRIFPRLLSNLSMLLMRVMWGRGQNTCLLKVISVYQDSSQSLLLVRKIWIIYVSVLRTRTNQKNSRWQDWSKKD